MSTTQVPAAFADVLTIVTPSDVRPRDDGSVADVGDRLVVSARAGNRDAFGDLVLLHQRAAYRTALTALGSREDAEEVVQDAFVIAWRKLSGFRGDATFRTWLLTIVWRKALDRRRKRAGWLGRLLHTRPDGESEWAPIDVTPSATADPERATIARDLAARTRDEITRLSPKLKDALLLAAAGEHSYDEIATILRIPLGTVKWRVAEARRLLKQRLIP